MFQIQKLPFDRNSFLKSLFFYLIMAVFVWLSIRCKMTIYMALFIAALYLVFAGNVSVMKVMNAWFKRPKNIPTTDQSLTPVTTGGVEPVPPLTYRKAWAFLTVFLCMAINLIIWGFDYPAAALLILTFFVFIGAVNAEDLITDYVKFRL